jgi:hypothetical protein
MTPRVLLHGDKTINFNCTELTRDENLEFLLFGWQSQHGVLGQGGLGFVISIRYTRYFLW